MRAFIFDYESGNQALFTDGTSEATAVDAGTPTGLDTVRLGRLGTASSPQAYLNGFMELFRYTPVAGLN